MPLEDVSNYSEELQHFEEINLPSSSLPGASTSKDPPHLEDSNSCHSGTSLRLTTLSSLQSGLSSQTGEPTPQQSLQYNSRVPSPNPLGVSSSHSSSQKGNNRGNSFSRGTSPREELKDEGDWEDDIQEESIDTQCPQWNFRKREEDADILFFRSVLPDVRKMTEKQKRTFRRKVLDALDEVLD